jgi:hypothetical protein
MTRGKPQESYTCIGPKEYGDWIGLCGKPSVAKSLCGAHQRRLLRRGTLARKRAPDGTFTPCKHPLGCPNPTSQQGWCTMHAARIQKHGDPGPAGAVGNVATVNVGPCKRRGCQRPSRTKGWCHLHFNRVYTKGSPGPVGLIRDPSTWRKPCKHPEGCARRGNGGDGWCDMHSQRVKRHGDPGPVGRLAGPAKKYCQHPEVCGRPVFARGWCAAHYYRVNRYGDPGPVAVRSYKRTA